MSDSKLFCAVCNEEIPAYKNGFQDIDTNEYKWTCDPCYIKVWPSPISLIFHAGVPLWTEPVFRTEKFLRNLQGFSEIPCIVHFFHRKETETLAWVNTWDYSRKQYLEPYSCRGQCNYDKIFILVDELETPESIQWLVYHELGHLACQKMAFIDRAWALENKTEGREHYDWKNDVAHEADSEERFVNRIATAYMGGKQYDRFWWRKRVNAKLRGDAPETWPI